MSGGHYDYLYFDAEQVRRGVACMAEDAREDDEIPDGAVEALDGIVESIEGNEELLRAIEWYKSGDTTADAIAVEAD